MSASSSLSKRRFCQDERHSKIGTIHFGGVLHHSARVRKQKTLKISRLVTCIEDYHKLTQTISRSCWQKHGLFMLAIVLPITARFRSVSASFSTTLCFCWAINSFVFSASLLYKNNWRHNYLLRKNSPIFRLSTTDYFGNALGICQFCLPLLK